MCLFSCAGKTFSILILHFWTFIFHHRHKDAMNKWKIKYSSTMHFIYKQNILILCNQSNQNKMQHFSFNHILTHIFISIFKHQQNYLGIYAELLSSFHLSFPSNTSLELVIKTHANLRCAQIYCPAPYFNPLYSYIYFSNPLHVLMSL